MSNKKRTYSSATRKAQARTTRMNILEAARKLFQQDGYENVTIEKIAQSAGVSAATVYALFRSKRGIIQAFLDEALPNTEFESLVVKARNATPVNELQVCAAIARSIYDAERVQMETFPSISVLSSEFKEIEKEYERRRFHRQEGTIKKLVFANVLRTGLDEAKARDILWACTGRDMYRLLVIERGWSSDEYERWLARLLISELIGNYG